MREVVGRVDQCCEQMLNFVAAQGDQVFGRWVLSAFGGCGHGEEGVREHGEGDPTVPGSPTTDLVLVQAGQAFAGLERLLDRPSAPSDPHQGGQRNGGG
ncbi:hypothetical protein [Streptomyces canus]|uniref:hypothetical protein n=1 Tax=Streptomyces canus TaxID=58343 RepID=UPI0027812E89|nr:hypothetical protein [Streptomyces canus]MDQ1065214.1 hypothetical protein [Streptomyces canus]